MRFTCLLENTALVYTLPARPAWNTAYPMLFFFLTALSAGPLLVTVLASREEGTVCKPALHMTGLMLLLSLLVSAAYPVTQGANLNMPLGWLLVRLLIGQIIPAFILLRQAHGKMAVGAYLSVLFVLVFIGELLGHQLFYESVLPYPLFPM